MATWNPTLADVGALLRARTRSDASGGELGTFNATTRPTGTEVQSFIDHAAAELELRLPDEITDKQQAFAKRLAALRAAMSVELSYAPESVNEEDSAYARLREQFDSGLAALHDALEDEGAGGATAPRMVAVPLTTPTAASSPYPYEADELLP